MSTILVAGSSGAFFYIADHIIQMDCYKPVEITERVKALCKEHQAPRTQAPGFAVPGFAEAYAAGKSKNAKVKTFGRDTFSIDLGDGGSALCEQMADFEQTFALAYLTRYALEQLADGRKTLRQLATELQKRIETKGWNGLTGSYGALRAGKAEDSGNFCGIGSLPGIRMQAPSVCGCVRREWGE